MSAPAALVKLDNATFSYGSTTVLEKMTFTLSAGELIALIGPNGAGKTTLMRGVLGLATSTGITRSYRGIGYVPQTTELDPTFPVTALDVVRMQKRRMDTATGRRALERVGLQDREAVRFGDLSGGQQQRVLVARAIATNPDLILLDEPFNGLDQPSRQQLLHLIAQLKKENVGFLCSTHDLVLAHQAADKVLLVNRGQVACGPTATTLTEANLHAAGV